MSSGVTETVPVVSAFLCSTMLRTRPAGPRSSLRMSPTMIVSPTSAPLSALPWMKMSSPPSIGRAKPKLFESETSVAVTSSSTGISLTLCWRSIKISRLSFRLWSAS